MDPKDFEDRVASLVHRMAGGVDNDPDGLRADILSLRARLEREGQLLSEAERAMLREALDGFIEMIDTPGVLDMVAEASANPLPPQPAIFDAIDLADLEDIKTALETWDINTRYGEAEKTALYHAMASTDADIAVMHALLDAGADPRFGLAGSNVLHGLGFALLQDIAAEDLAGVIRRCIAAGADIEARSAQLQWTPLIMAASEWNAVATEALLMCGADVHAVAGPVHGVYGAGKTAATFADGHAPTLNVLKQYM
ncbi:MAG: hypothetical protein AAGM84_17630 [Pseudomonadota bacterium]